MKTVQKHHAQRLWIGVLIACVLFVLTFVFNSFFQNQLFRVADTNAVSDWQFVAGTSEEEISAEQSVYLQANAANPVRKSFGQQYLRLHKTIEGSSQDRILTLNTANNTLKILLNDKEIFNNGYNKTVFSGSRYERVVIPAGENEQTLDIFVYAPLAFALDATLGSTGMQAGTVAVQMAGTAFAMALCLVGLLLLSMSFALSAVSADLGRMVLLSCTVFLGGVTALLYSMSGYLAVFTAPIWHSAELMLQFLLMAATYCGILLCCKSTAKSALFALPVAFACALLLLFPSVPAAAVAAYGITAVCQLLMAVFGLRALSRAEQNGHMQIGLMSGLLLYAALIGLYNAVTMALGIPLMSGDLFIFCTALVSVVLFISYYRSGVYDNIRVAERERQIRMDTVWMDELAGLLSTVFLQKTEADFLTQIAKSMVDVIERHAETDEIDVRVCVATADNGNYQEIYRQGADEECDYERIASFLEKQPTRLLIGESTIDMLFVSGNDHHSVIHFENIIGGKSNHLDNIVRSAYNNLELAYRNHNLNQDMSSMQETTFIQLATIVEQRSSETQKHQLVVAALAYRLCEQLGMDEEETHLISLAAMTHDIGKIAVSDSILQKADRLSNEEYEVMKRHTQYGYNILSLQKGRFFEVAALIALQHHENFDGTGYNGMRGAEISRAAQIVHIADVFDALLSERCYKEGWSPEKVISYIADASGTLFDPAIVRIFMSCRGDLLALRKSVYAEEAEK